MELKVWEYYSRWVQMVGSHVIVGPLVSWLALDQRWSLLLLSVDAGDGVGVRTQLLRVQSFLCILHLLLGHL